MVNINITTPLYYLASICICILTLTACNGDSGNNDPTAVLLVNLDKNVAARLEISSESYPGNDQRIIAESYTVEHVESGDIVYGPKAVIPGLNSGTLKVIPAREYAGDVQDISGYYRITLQVTDDAGNIDTTDTTVFLDGLVTYPIVNSCNAQCTVTSTTTTNEFITCPLNTACNVASIQDDVVSQASNINSNVTDSNVIIALQAYGAGGGNGATAVSNSGDGGSGGYAQLMVSSVSELADADGFIYYRIGKEGTHISGTAGSGGAATLIATDSDYNDLNNMLAISGGGGGGGYGGEAPNGTNGGAAGIAISTTTSSANNAGNDGTHSSGGHNGKGGNKDGKGTGGAAGSEKNGYSADAGTTGIGGYGGSQGTAKDKCTGHDNYLLSRWINDSSTTNTTGNGGKGGKNGGDCWGGAGGGGYGGGGGGSVYEQEGGHSGTGGGGGGSWSAQSSASSTANLSYSTTGGNGEAVITFILTVD